MTTRQEYEQTVSFPGKFEQEQAYVPYFWDQYLNGHYDDDRDNILSFIVNADDQALFPDLELGQTIRLIELDNGFVTAHGGLRS